MAQQVDRCKEAQERADSDPLAGTGYSEAARRAISRRLEEEPEEGPEEADFNRAIRRSAEERTDD